MLKTINVSSVLSTFNLFSILQALILNLFYVKKKKEEEILQPGAMTPTVSCSFLLTLVYKVS